MITVYMIPNHPRCQKAITSLQQEEVAFCVRNLLDHPLTYAEFLAILQQAEGLNSLLSSNRRLLAPLLEEYGVDSIEDLSISQVYEMVSRCPSVLRLPITQKSGTIVVGFGHDYSTFLPRSKKLAIFSRYLQACRREEDKRLEANLPVEAGRYGG